MNTSQKRILYSFIALIVMLYCVVQGIKGGDFKKYMGAAELLKEGKSCYNEWIFLGGENYGRYLYSPFFAILLLPFTYFPAGAAAVLWLLLNLFFLFRIARLSQHWHKRICLQKGSLNFGWF
tara:strand:+ start:214 stop:579 length:366 start_codon:yes stop_codon:yes gene_type:complete